MHSVAPDANMKATPQDKAAPSSALAILQDCRGIASRRLPSLLYEVLKQIKSELMEIAPSTQKYELFALYREALDITQGRWSLIESRFRTHLLDLFDQEVRNAPKAAKKVLRTDSGDDFKLMDADDLEESLAVNTIANAIKSVCINELMALNPRMGTLLKDPEFQRRENPISPEILGSALMVTLSELEGSTKAKLVLVPMLSKYFPSRAQAVYREINEYLAGKGVLPGLPTVHHKTSGETDDAAANKRHGSQTSATGTNGKPESPQDLFAMLQRLMTLGRIGEGLQSPKREDGPLTQLGLSAGGSKTDTSPDGQTATTVGDKAGTVPGESANEENKSFPAPPAAGYNLRNGILAQAGLANDPPLIFLTQLTHLQHGDVTHAASEGLSLTGIAPEQLDDGRVNVLHEIRQSESARNLGEVDSMTLDIVAMLFDFILDDRRIPDAMKALIGRLQIPLLKVALIDKSVFGNKLHPARLLLDSLAKAAMGWNDAEGHESDLYQKISTLVQRVVREFDNDIGLFEAVLADLQVFMEQERAAAATHAAQAATQLREEELRDKPTFVAREEIQRRLEFQALPKLVRQFLHRYWEPLLVKIYMSQGQDSDTWIKAITTMDDLVWSVTPKQTSQDRKKLLVILPKLLKWLDQGLLFLGTPQSERDPFFTELVKYHTEAVRPGLDDADFAKAFDIAIARPSEMSPIKPESQEFEPVEPDMENTEEPDAAIIEEISAPPEVETDVEEIVINDVTWASGELEDQTPKQVASVGANTDYDAIVKNLKRGTWIEVETSKGECMRAKLAWVSPLRGVYLFTNRLGQKAISINAAGLAAKFREGRVRLIDNVSLMDRAVGGLINRLQKPYP